MESSTSGKDGVVALLQTECHPCGFWYQLRNQKPYQRSKRKGKEKKIYEYVERKKRGVCISQISGTSVERTIAEAPPFSLCLCCTFSQFHVVIDIAPPLQTHGLVKLARSNRYYDTSHIGTSNSKDNLGRYGQSHLVGNLCVMRFVISSSKIGVEMQKLQESKLKILSLSIVATSIISIGVCGSNF